MDLKIVTEYSFWFVIFCFLLGALYSGILYFKNKKEEFPNVLLWIMAVLRFLSISLISFLLLSPLIKTITRNVEKPVIIIAQDNSNSIAIGKDSLYYKNEYVKLLFDFKEKLNEKYKVATYTFGEKVDDNFSVTFIEKQSDISTLFSEISARYSNRNVGAIILASDGIYNKGINPVYASEKIKFPVYTIALGDTNVQKDIILKKVNYNRIAFLGNKFPLEVIVNANKCSGLKSRLSVYSGKKVLFSKTIDFKNDRFFETIPIQLEAKQKSLQKYVIKLSTVAQEISTENNSELIFIDVIDGKQKILILSNAPHPDVSAIKQAIESNINYEVETEILKDFTKSFSGYNLVILHQIPTNNRYSEQVVRKLNNSQTPVLFILGAQSNLNYFNSYRTGLNITAQKISINESQAIVNPNFTLFNLSDETKRTLKKFPPLLTLFGKYKIMNSADVLFYQKIGAVSTKLQLILFNQTLDKKIGIIAGEGIWKWHLSDYLNNENHLAFNEIITKTVQYLSLKAEKSFFRVLNKNNYLENQPVEFDAEVYNKSYELINEPEITLTIVNSEKKKFPYVFGKRGKAYYLNAGNFPVGEYRFSAKVKVGDTIYKKTGVFNILALNVESINTIANHRLLYNLAKKHDAEMFYPSQFDKLHKLLENREDIKSISYSQKSYNELVNLKWVFFLILALLSSEWFIRKRGGSY